MSREELVSRNDEVLDNWEEENKEAERIFRIAPFDIGAVGPSVEKVLETSTLIIQVLLSLLLLAFAGSGAYLVWYIPSDDLRPVGYTFMIISLLFLIGVNYGYIARYREDLRRSQRVQGYYLLDNLFNEVSVVKVELTIRSWTIGNLLEFKINNLDERNTKLDRVVNLVYRDSSGRPRMTSLFRLSFEHVPVAREFINKLKSLPAMDGLTFPHLESD